MARLLSESSRANGADAVVNVMGIFVTGIYVSD